jgi:hypothetical protein
MNTNRFICSSIIAGCFVLSCSAAYADPVSSEAADPGHIVVPAIPGVPKMFLPDIGIAGDFAYERQNLQKSDPRYVSEQPRIRDGQAVFFEPIDPYTNAQFTIDLPENGTANIEEAWIYFNKLPGNTSVRVGRFLPRFGLLDLMNTFQLPMVDRPHAIGNYLTPDGLTSTGLEANAYIPNPWDWNLKLNLNAVRGDALGGASDLDLTYLATLDYSRDLFTSGSFESGVSVAQGPSPLGLSETLEEPYLQIQYAPTQRKIWTWSAEGMLAQRRGLGSEDDKEGFYTFLDYNFSLRYHVGFLVDVADQAVAPYGKQLGLAPNATWFLSDNTRLRLQYTHNTPLGGERPEERVTLQATFSLGNLKQLE